MLIGLLISVVLAATFLSLYVCAVQDKASLNKDNEWLRKQREDLDSRILDKDAVIKAVDAKGYSHRDDGCSVYLKRGDVGYQIEVDRFPIVQIASVYNVDENEYDIATFRKAAQEITKNCAIGKVLAVD